MTVNKVEFIGILLCIGVMSVALLFLKSDSTGNVLGSLDTSSQVASVTSVDEEKQKLENDLRNAMGRNGEIIKMVTDDVVVGIGAEVKAGDTVSVHYVGTLQNGQQFDNSNTRGEPFTFTIGEGKVIKGWDEGLVGMKVGGQRLLVIPPGMAYGANAVGPIPPNSTLLFSIELIEIK